MSADPVQSTDKDPSHHDEIKRLTRDLIVAANTLSDNEARFLVDAYYAIQDNRKRSDQQVLSLQKSGEPCTVLQWFGDQERVLESQVKRALGRYADSRELGQWAQSIVGIGPVITAGLMAHIDITKAPTVGHIWRYAGLDPTQQWNKGEKRPWNAALKTLCWKIGESFVKFCNHENCFYGHIYVQRKAYEMQRNEAGELADQAKGILERKKFRRESKARKFYESGSLPPDHIHSRAKRYACKLFLAHFHQKAYELHYGKPAPLPYPIAHLGHAHMIHAPQP
jgi:hypothetical protein